MNEDNEEPGALGLRAKRRRAHEGKGRRARLAPEKEAPATAPPIENSAAPFRTGHLPKREGARRRGKLASAKMPPSAPSYEGNLAAPLRAERSPQREGDGEPEKKPPTMAGRAESPIEPPLSERPARGHGKPGALARRSGILPSTASPAQPFATPLAPWPEPAEHVQVLLTMRKSRRRRFLLRLALFCGLPTLLTALYMIFVASPRYISEAQLTYQTYQPPQKLSQGLVQTLIGTSQSNTVDLGVVLDQYIQSPALLKKLDSELHLRKYYSNPKVDYFSRMNPKASFDTFLRYYQWYVSVSYALGGYVTVTVEAFDPQFAAKLAQAIVKASDQMVNDLSARARQDEVTYAKDELRRQEEQVKKARLALTDFEDAHRDINPPRSASQLTGIVGTLQSDLATARTELNDLLAYMSATSPQVAAVKFKIAALEKQLNEQQGKLANSGNGTPYSKILEQYSALELDEEFAKNAYQAAQQGLEVAHADAARQVSYLVDFAPPYVPDKPSLTIPVVYTLTVFIASLVLFGIGSLIAAAFRDHAGI